MPISNGNNLPFILNLYWEENDQPALELLNPDDPLITLNNAVEVALNNVLEDYFNTTVVAAIMEGSAFPPLPAVPTFPLTEMFLEGGQGSKPAKMYRCPMEECLALGRGQVVHLHNLTRHFVKFHEDIYKGNPLYPCKANELRFLFDKEDKEEEVSFPPSLPPSQPNSQDGV